MVELIVGEKGKGKTKALLDRVEASVRDAKGNLVYIDKDQKHMLELSNKVRLISAEDYPLASCMEFMGFLCGVISQDHDIETIFLDNFMKIASLPEEGIEPAVIRLDEISKLYDVNLIVSIGLDQSKLSDIVKKYVTVAL